MDPLRNSKRRLGGVAIFALVTSLASASFGETLSDESFQSAPEPGLGYLGYTAYPFYSVGGSNPGLIGMKTKDNKVSSVVQCDSISDTKCPDSDFFQYRSTLNFCETDTESDCIEEVYAENELGLKLKVMRSEDYFTDKTNNYLGNVGIGLPPGKNPPLVEIPEAPHQGGTFYLPLVTSYGTYDVIKDKFATTENGEIALFAVSKINGVYPTNRMSLDPKSYYARNAVNNLSPNLPCVFNDSAHCARAWPIPKNLRLGIKVRNSGSIKGWFHGRITDPTIKQVKGPGSGVTLTVFGNPIQVPSISLWRKKSELPEQVMNYYSARRSQEFPLGGSGSGAGNVEAQNGPEEKWSLMRDNKVDFNQVKFDEFLAWLPASGDKANLMPSVWILKLMTNYGTGGLIQSDCQRDLSDVTGIVSTNATQYLAGPPTYDSVNNELSYQVAAPHLQPDGSLVRGTYDLALRSDLARCLYGVTGTSFKVSVSVMSNNNELIEAVTGVVEKDGWFYFSAKGFTFSSPKIKVKFVRESPPQSSATSTEGNGGTFANQVLPTKSPKVAAKKSVTCVKGKSIKKVMGTKPKCPKGWKVR